MAIQGAYKANKTGSIVGNCYSTDHIAEEDNVHTHITCNIEEPQIITALERSVIDYWALGWFGGLN